MLNCDWMETQNLVISFDYGWFLAKNLVYAECIIMKFHNRNSSSVQKPKFKDKEAIWEWKHKLRLIPNVLVLKLGGLSQSQRLENIFLGLLTDDLDQLDRDFFCPLSKNLVWPCLSICFVHKEICIIISGVCKNTGSSVLT